MKSRLAATCLITGRTTSFASGALMWMTASSSFPKSGATKSMLYVLIHNGKIRGIYSSETRSLRAANDLLDAYGNVDWEGQELTGGEVFFVVRKSQRIRVIGIEQDKLLSIGEPV
jgi:hypothetical protein